MHFILGDGSTATYSINTAVFNGNQQKLAFGGYSESLAIMGQLDMPS